MTSQNAPVITTNINNSDYDESKMENQSKTILELQNDIREFQKRERAYLVKLHLKDKEIKQLENHKSDLIKRQDPETVNKGCMYYDPLVLQEFNIYKNLIKEKDDLLQNKDEELNCLQTNPNHPLFKRLVNKCRDLHKENMELYNYTQGGTLENLRYENGLEKGQIDQLMSKLKEREQIQKDLENEIHELSDTHSVLSKKLKDLEAKSLEQETKEKEKDVGKSGRRGKDKEKEKEKDQ